MISIANNLQLKVSDLSNGIYFIVGKNKATTINQKIIVNKYSFNFIKLKGGLIAPFFYST